MSESAIGLKTFFEFEGRSPPKEVVIKNPDYFLSNTEVKLPQTGFTFLYGFKGAQFLLGNAIERSLQKGSELCLVNAQAYVGKYSVDKQELSHFGDFRFLNLPRQVTTATRKDIRQRWELLLKKHGLEDDFPKTPSSHLFLLDELVNEEPYDQLTAIAYEVNTEIGRAHLVTVFKAEMIHAVQANSIHKVKVRLALPNGEII